jgi:hypothetical protein
MQKCIYALSFLLLFLTGCKYLIKKKRNSNITNKKEVEIDILKKIVKLSKENNIKLILIILNNISYNKNYFI